MQTGLSSCDVYKTAQAGMWAGDEGGVVVNVTGFYEME
jgi:hypothetical protein